MPGQSGPESNGNEGVLRIPQRPSITGTSPSDCLVSYSGALIGGSYPSVEVQSVYSSAPSWLGNKAQLITTIFRWLKKFCSACKSVDDQSTSSRLKAVDSEAVLRDIMVNPVSVSRKVSGELGIPLSSLFVTFTTTAKLCLGLHCDSRYRKSFDAP